MLGLDLGEAQHAEVLAKKVNSTTTARYTGRSARNDVRPDPESLAKTLENSLGLNNDQADNVDGPNEELKDKLVMPVIPIWKSTQ